jgi:hypothetical protein
MNRCVDMSHLTARTVNDAVRAGSIISSSSSPQSDAAPLCHVSTCLTQRPELSPLVTYSTSTAILRTRVGAAVEELLHSGATVRRPELSPLVTYNTSTAQSAHVLLLQSRSYYTLGATVRRPELSPLVTYSTSTVQYPRLMFVAQPAVNDD